MDDVIPTWVYPLLKRYGNAVLPDSVISYYGSWYTAELLTDIMGVPVEVKAHKLYDTDEYGRRKTKICYIAWVIRS